MVAGHPVQATAGGDVVVRGGQGRERVVVAGQLEPAAGPVPRPLRGVGEGGEAGDGAAVAAGQRPGHRTGTVQVTSPVVVDVVADGRSAGPRGAHAATSPWASEA